MYGKSNKPLSIEIDRKVINIKKTINVRVVQIKSAAFNLWSPKNTGDQDRFSNSCIINNAYAKICLKSYFPSIKRINDANIRIYNSVQTGGKTQLGG